MRVLLCLAVLLLAQQSLAASQPPLPAKRFPTRDQWKFSHSLTYAQTSQIWGTVTDVRRAEGSLPALNNVLRAKYGEPEEVFSRLGFRVDPAEVPIFVTFDAEALASGLVQNPVIPELHAVGVAGGWLGAGYRGHYEGFDYEAGLVGSLGWEKRIDGASTDLIDKIPLRNGRLVSGGAEFELERSWKMEPAIVLDGSLRTRHLYFSSTAPVSSLDETQTAKFWTHRWKAQLVGTTPLAPFAKDESTRGGVVIAVGQQPLPEGPGAELPRYWDYVHRLGEFPEIGTLLGAGLTGVYAGTLEAKAGFFGGYFGGAASAHWKCLALELASWGIETTTAYRTLGERLWLAQLRISY